jgi:hypothetical protein
MSHRIEESSFQQLLQKSAHVRIANLFKLDIDVKVKHLSSPIEATSAASYSIEFLPIILLRNLLHYVALV